MCSRVCVSTHKKLSNKILLDRTSERDPALLGSKSSIPYNTIHFIQFHGKFLLKQLVSYIVYTQTDTHTLPYLLHFIHELKKLKDIAHQFKNKRAITGHTRSIGEAATALKPTQIQFKLHLGF